MITRWILSENDWEYYGAICVKSNTKPVVNMLDDSYEMIVDGVRIIFDEEIVQKEDGE